MLSWARNFPIDELQLVIRSMSSLLSPYFQPNKYSGRFYLSQDRFEGVKTSNPDLLNPINTYLVLESLLSMALMMAPRQL